MTDGLVEVRIFGLPVRLWARSQEHVDDLIREFTLIAEGQQRSGRVHEVPARLIRLIEDLTKDYSGFSGPQEEALSAAAAEGVESLDLVYQMPATVADGSRHLGEMLDQADEYCRAGVHLLTLATPPDLVRFRRWFLQEFIDQIGGAAPTVWSNYQG